MKITIACISPDDKFTLNIRDLDINAKAIDRLCGKVGCREYRISHIRIESQYDKRVTITIAQPYPYEDADFNAITIGLPYSLDKNYFPAVSVIKPEEYNWKESVRVDLIFLREAGVLEITDAQIATIPNLAAPNSNILKCRNKWRRVSSNCDCERCIESKCASF